MQSCQKTAIFEAGLSATKVNDSPLSFVAESSIIDFMVGLDAPRDISCVYMCFKRKFTLKSNPLNVYQ